MEEELSSTRTILRGTSRLSEIGISEVILAVLPSAVTTKSLLVRPNTGFLAASLTDSSTLLSSICRS
ncbi:MAG TPA: hypothetical protein VFF53_11155, partial [Geobacteraceae bacterium]|nr:hypothetical protein [Geobacteraceae bacterium]